MYTRANIHLTTYILYMGCLRCCCVLPFALFNYIYTFLLFMYMYRGVYHTCIVGYSVVYKIDLDLEIDLVLSV